MVRTPLFTLPMTVKEDCLLDLRESLRFLGTSRGRVQKEAPREKTGLSAKLNTQPKQLVRKIRGVTLFVLQA